MTVVLFSTIIIWVSSIPTPVAQTRLDLQSQMVPIYVGSTEVGVNITLTHQGGEALQPIPTILYITSQRGSNPPKTDIVRLHLYNKLLGSPSGLVDGKDSVWSVGERWAYKNTTLRSTDVVTVTIVDTLKSVILWSSQVNAPVGTRPPVFVDKWADGLYSTDAIDPVQSGLGVYLFAKVADPDNDLNAKSVYATITAWYGTPDPCSKAQAMRDDGLFPDKVSGDGVFTLGGISCMKPPYPNLDWAGSIVLFNATDKAGHATQSRIVLDVIPGPPGSGGGGGTNGTGRPANLRWNGRQGYNIFNASEWDRFKYTAKETRTFRGSEEVIVVVGSLDLENTFDTDRFTLYDPFSGYPSQPVVYGTNKGVTSASTPSSTQAFTFLEFINGYYIFTFRFKLSPPTYPVVGTNYYKVPTHPPQYFFAKYTLDILLFSASAVRFNTTDSVQITDEDGYMRDFPQVQTFKDAGFTKATARFNSTDVAYVQVRMFTTDATVTNVIFGNVIIKDYAGGTQLMRAPVNGHDANVPICPVSPPCSGTAVTISGALRVYRFAINFTRATQDPWVEGTQNYALTISSIRDSDESYANVATQLVVVAPLYKLDVVAGTDSATNNAWGTKDYSYYYQNLNGLDRWRVDRIEYCGLSGTCKTSYHTISIVYIDFDRDGDLDTVSSIFVDNSNGQIVLHRRDLDSQGNIVFTRFVMENLAGIYCNALAVGDVTGDGAPEVVCGASNGAVWYYKNDGSWQGGVATKIAVDNSRTQSISAVAIGDFNGDGGNDIAVAGGSGRLTWYPNLDKLGKLPEHLRLGRQLRTGPRVHVHGAGAVGRHDERGVRFRPERMDVRGLGGPRHVRERRVGRERRQPRGIRVHLDQLGEQSGRLRILLPGLHRERFPALHRPAEPRLEGRRLRGDGRRQRRLVRVRRHDERRPDARAAGVVVDIPDRHDELGDGQCDRRERQSPRARDVLPQDRHAHAECRQRLHDDGRLRQRRPDVVVHGRPGERARTVLADHTSPE